MDFIDIFGASGTAYRFRRWPHSGFHPPIAGCYAIVADRGRTIVAIGMMEDLSRAQDQLGVQAKGGEIFTRLNISRRLREAEHADIALRYSKPAEEPQGEASAHQLA